MSFNNQDCIHSTEVDGCAWNILIYQHTLDATCFVLFIFYFLIFFLVILRCTHTCNRQKHVPKKNGYNNSIILWGGIPSKTSNHRVQKCWALVYHWTDSFYGLKTILFLFFKKKNLSFFGFLCVFFVVCMYVMFVVFVTCVTYFFFYKFHFKLLD